MKQLFKNKISIIFLIISLVVIAMFTLPFLLYSDAEELTDNEIECVKNGQAHLYPNRQFMIINTNADSVTKDFGDGDKLIRGSVITIFGIKHKTVDIECLMDENGELHINKTLER